jgi:hypothetical protein
MTEDSANLGRQADRLALFSLTQEGTSGTSEKAAIRALARKKPRRVSQAEHLPFSFWATRDG